MHSVQPVTPAAAYIGGKRLLARTIVERIEAIPHTLYVRHLRSEVASLTAQAAQAADAARTNAAAVEAIQTEALRTQHILAETHQAELARLKRTAALKEEIARVPVTTNCVDSPAVRAALERLRQ